jgi:hypothetical protein
MPAVPDIGGPAIALAIIASVALIILYATARREP